MGVDEREGSTGLVCFCPEDLDLEGPFNMLLRSVSYGVLGLGWILLRAYLLVFASQGTLESLKIFSFSSHAPAEVLCDDTFLVSTNFLHY